MSQFVRIALVVVMTGAATREATAQLIDGSATSGRNDGQLPVSPQSNMGTGNPAPSLKFGQEGTVKVRVPCAGWTPELSSYGARIVGDYSVFLVLEIPVSSLPMAINAEVLTEANLILLNAGPIDTTSLVAKQLQNPRETFEGRALHLVHFAGPIRPNWMDELVATGVQIVTYIPSNAYLVYGDTNQIASLQNLASVHPDVQWNGAYLDEYKIDPSIRQLINNNQLAPGNDGLIAIQLVANPEANRATLAAVDRLKSAPIQSSTESLGYHNIIVRIPPERIPELSKQSDIVSIQRYAIPLLFCERQAQIVSGHISGNGISGPGYLAWLTTQGFNQAQFTTSNFAVDVTDSGLDNGTISPNHFGLYVDGTRPGTSRVVYNRLIGTPNSNSTILGCDGHGTINSHIIGGYSSQASAPFADAQGYHFGLGIAPFVRLGSTVIFDPNSFTFPNYKTIQSMAYSDSVRISSNSWGADDPSYTIDAQTYDGLVRDAQPTGAAVPAPGNQEMVIVFANGNAGPGTGTVGTPATAKNVISVGAAENVQAFGGADASGVSDSGANSVNDIISFSSRGPTSDGRRKPDLMAPGTHVSGGVAQAANPGPTGTADPCFNASGVSGGPGGSNFFPTAGQQLYTASSGTSHSCPGVAGGCALIRQFFINQGGQPPSPAMTKAILMNSARYMSGTGALDTLWSNSQGMGEMNLAEAFKRELNPVAIIRDQEDLFTASGQSIEFNGSVTDSAQSFRVTLAWTDAPGSTSGAAFKNDLDLTVTIAGNTYLGNVFGGAFSATDGSRDSRNNVESVFLLPGISGDFTVTITAANINSDGVPNNGLPLDQDFAIVVYNGLTCPGIQITTETLPDLAVGIPINQILSVEGGMGPYEWTVSSGVLPDGLTLANNGVLSGTPTDESPKTVTIKALDSLGCFDKKQYVLSPALTITPLLQTGICVNDSSGPLGSDPLVTGGVPPHNYNWTVISGPAQFDPAVSVLEHPTIKPPIAQDYSIQLTVTDSANPPKVSSATTVLRVGEKVAIDPGLYLRYHPIITVGEVLPFAKEFTATGGLEPYTYEWTIVDNPNGYATLDITNPTGATFVTTQPGTYMIQLIVREAAGCSATARFSLTAVANGPVSRTSGGSPTPGVDSPATDACGVGTGMCAPTGILTIAGSMIGFGLLRSRVKRSRGR